MTVEDSEQSGSGLDRLLHRLCVNSHPDRDQDPQAWLQQRELFAGIEELLISLTPRERDIFDAHVFRQLPLSEIARLLRDVDRLRLHIHF